MDIGSLRPIRTSAATVLTSEATSSLTYVDLATPGPSFTAVTSTIACVSFTCIAVKTTALQTAYVALTASGANTIAPGTAYEVAGSSTGASYLIDVATRWSLTGLAPGSTTFSVQYRVDGGTFNFFRRVLSLFPYAQ